MRHAFVLWTDTSIEQKYEMLPATWGYTD